MLGVEGKDIMSFGGTVDVRVLLQSVMSTQGRALIYGVTFCGYSLYADEGGGRAWGKRKECRIHVEESRTEEVYRQGVGCG